MATREKEGRRKEKREGAGKKRKWKNLTIFFFSKKTSMEVKY